MVNDTLSEIEKNFSKLIDYLKLKSQSDSQFLDYLKYVENQFLFFKENLDHRNEKGVLIVYFIGQSISRYADEFDWGGYTKKKELNCYLDKICELVIILNTDK